jgi:hypothetical protein
MIDSNRAFSYPTVLSILNVRVPITKFRYLVADVVVVCRVKTRCSHHGSATIYSHLQASRAALATTIHTAFAWPSSCAVNYQIRPLPPAARQAPHVYRPRVKPPQPPELAVP